MPHRDVLIVPLDEIVDHFAKNKRQDIKVIAPTILTDDLYEKLRAKGKEIKQEVPLVGEHWTRSPATRPNRLCESGDFGFDPGDTKGAFSISFANEKAGQDEHWHVRHSEIYFSEHRISGYYRTPSSQRDESFDLPDGGAIVFGPNVVHYMEMYGLTIIIEVPAVEGDKFP